MSAKPTSAGTKAKKKPYEVKRADLNLDSYIAEQKSQDPLLLVQRGIVHLLQSRQFFIYVVLQLLTAWYGFGQPFFCVGVLWAFVANTGRRKEGEMSAYSVFNEGGEAIEGSTDIAALDRELRTRGGF